MKYCKWGLNKEITVCQVIFHENVSVLKTHQTMTKKSIYLSRVISSHMVRKGAAQNRRKVLA